MHRKPHFALPTQFGPATDWTALRQRLFWFTTAPVKNHFATGADGETRTLTAFATAPSRRRVYQFHHVGCIFIPQALDSLYAGMLSLLALTSAPPAPSCLLAQCPALPIHRAPLFREPTLGHLAPVSALAARCRGQPARPSHPDARSCAPRNMSGRDWW
jgi:hypothetical protein